MMEQKSFTSPTTMCVCGMHLNLFFSGWSAAFAENIKFFFCRAGDVVQSTILFLLFFCHD